MVQSKGPSYQGRKVTGVVCLLLCVVVGVSLVWLQVLGYVVCGCVERVVRSNVVHAKYNLIRAHSH